MFGLARATDKEGSSQRNKLARLEGCFSRGAAGRGGAGGWGEALGHHTQTVKSGFGALRVVGGREKRGGGRRLGRYPASIPKALQKDTWPWVHDTRVRPCKKKVFHFPSPPTPQSTTTCTTRCRHHHLQTWRGISRRGWGRCSSPAMGLLGRVWSLRWRYRHGPAVRTAPRDARR